MTIQDNLFAYWPLNETAGTRVDASSGVNDLTDNNTVGSLVGIIGSGANFTRTNSEFFSASSSQLSFGDENFTIAGWFWLDSKSAPSQGLVSKWLDTGSQFQYLLQYDQGDTSTDRYRFVVSSDGSSTAVVAANNFGAPPTGVWTFVVAWHDSIANTINIQINNGTADSTAHAGGIFQSTAEFRIGANNSVAQDYMNGRADEVAIWNRVLTTQEKTNLYNGGLGFNLNALLNPPDPCLTNASGFFTTNVCGHLRPTAQIVQWNIASPDPSGRRHVESGSYRKTAHLQNVGGFTAQQESGVALDFGNIIIPEGGSGFETDTVNITFSMGESNSNVNSRFDLLFANGSGTASKGHVAFNFRMWIGNLDAFNIVAYSGINKDPIKISPVFHFRESAQWRKEYILALEVSGLPVSGVLIMPSGMPDCQNIFSRGNDITVSGLYLDREFSNFVYMKGFFPDLPVGTFYKLGTYGGLGQKDFTLKFSYDYTRLDSNILNPTDTKDFAVVVT